MSKTQQDPNLGDGDVQYVATVKLRLNYGKLEVEGGDVVVLGKADAGQGIHIPNLIRSGAIVPYTSDEQAAEIRDHYLGVVKPSREEMKREILAERRGKRGQTGK